MKLHLLHLFLFVIPACRQACAAQPAESPIAFIDDVRVCRIIRFDPVHDKKGSWSIGIFDYIDGKYSIIFSGEIAGERPSGAMLFPTRELLVVWCNEVSNDSLSMISIFSCKQRCVTPVKSFTPRDFFGSNLSTHTANISGSLVWGFGLPRIIGGEAGKTLRFNAGVRPEWLKSLPDEKLLLPAIDLDLVNLSIKIIE